MKRRHERGTWSTQNSRSEHFRSPKSNIFCTIIMPASLRSDCCSLSLRNRCSPSPEYPPESLRFVSVPTIAFVGLPVIAGPAHVECMLYCGFESRCLRHYFTFVQWYLTVICEGPCGLRRVP